MDVLDGWIKEREKTRNLINYIINNRDKESIVHFKLIELKKFLSLFDVTNEKKKILCIDHLKNLIKKWDNDDIAKLEWYIYKTIEKYEDKKKYVKINKKVKKVKD